MFKDNSTTSWKRFRLLVTGTLAVILMGLSVYENSVSQTTSEIDKEILALMQNSQDSSSEENLISIQFTNMTLVEALEKFAQEINVGFSYNPEIIPDKRVTLQMWNVPAHEVIYTLLEGTGLEPVLPPSKDVIVIREKEVKANYETYQETVQGSVVDAQSNESLPGVNVVVKGTSIGTSTNMNGRYELQVTSLSDTLLFSYIGYQTLEVPIDGQSDLNIQMTSQAIGIDDVVVVGYGTVSRENLTGSVSSVNMEALASRPLTSSSAALQGQMPGVYALQESGRAGGDGAIIRIRGIGTLNNSDPLVIIDGVPGNINNVNPQDIASISVLKDAASASIYGSRAANGVILINTKTGSTEGLSISYNGQFGLQSATAQPNMLNSVEYATLHNEASRNGGMQLLYSQSDIERFQQGGDPLFPNLNYRDIYYDDSVFMQNHQMNVSGGSEDLQYAFMLGYLDQDGILVANRHDRVNFRSNFDASFLEDDRLRFSVKLSGIRGTTIQPFNDGSTRWHSNLAPVIPLTNADGGWVAVFGEDNYFAEAQEGASNDNFRRVYDGQLSAQYDVYRGLSIESTYGYNLTQNRWNSFRANVLLDNLDGTTQNVASSLNENNTEDTHSMLNALMRYSESYNLHEFNALIGYQQEVFDNHWMSAFRRNFPNNTQRVISMGDPATQTTNGGASELKLQSYFGRIGYIYNNRYMFEVNLRQDGSSRFGEGNRWGTFPSFSVGWNLSEEDFIPDIDWLDFLKLRGSWGRLGNENIFSRYAATQILNTGQNYVTNGSNLRSGVATTTLANEDVTWETTTQVNVGLDFTIFDNFIFTVDYFQRNTEDILMQIPIPISMGNLNPPFQNVGGVYNQGLELSGEYTRQFDSGIFLNAALNLTHIQNEVTDLRGRSPIISGSTVLMEGHPINSFYGYKVDGLYQVDDFTWQNNSDPNIPHYDRNYVLKDGVVRVSNFTAQPGDLKYVDLNGDGMVSLDNDRTVIGNAQPDLTYSLRLNTAWKGFDTGIFLQGVYGIDGYVYGNVTHSFPNFFNMGDWWLDRWTIDNSDTNIPAVTHIDSRKQIHSEYYLEDASYLRIKNIELGYTLPIRHSSMIGVNRLRLYGSVQNAYTFTSFKGFDPERPSWDTSPEAYPQVRVFNLGLNINF